jgi:hypothetical protein
VDLKDNNICVGVMRYSDPEASQLLLYPSISSHAVRFLDILNAVETAKRQRNRRKDCVKDYTWSRPSHSDRFPKVFVCLVHPLRDHLSQSGNG